MDSPLKYSAWGSALGKHASCVIEKQLLRPKGLSNIEIGTPRKGGFLLVSPGKGANTLNKNTYLATTLAPAVAAHPLPPPRPGFERRAALLNSLPPALGGVTISSFFGSVPFLELGSMETQRTIAILGGYLDT